MSVLTYTYPHKHLRKIKVTIFNHQANSQLHVWPDVTLHAEPPDYLLCIVILYVTGRVISAEGIGLISNLVVCKFRNMVIP